MLQLNLRDHEWSDTYKVEKVDKLPQQMNAFDCGLYLCYYLNCIINLESMEEISYPESSFPFTKQTISSLRKYILNICLENKNHFH